jgi:hypothetical protein
MLSNAFDEEEEDLGDVGEVGGYGRPPATGRAGDDTSGSAGAASTAAFDGRMRPRGEPETGRRRDRGERGDRGDRGGRHRPRPMILGMTVLVLLLAIGAVALVLATSHAATGKYSAGPRVTDQMPNPSQPSAQPSQSAGVPMPRMSGVPAPAITTVAAADPIRYLEAVRAQIRTFVADGPATLDPTTGGDLQNSIIDIENSVVSAQRNGGAAHLQEIRNKIAKFDGRLGQLVGKERISAVAANQLTAEVQRLSGTVTD